MCKCLLSSYVHIKFMGNKNQHQNTESHGKILSKSHTRKQKIERTRASALKNQYTAKWKLCMVGCFFFLILSIHTHRQNFLLTALHSKVIPIHMVSFCFALKLYSTMYQVSIRWIFSMIQTQRYNDYALLGVPFIGNVAKIQEKSNSVNETKEMIA